MHAHTQLRQINSKYSWLMNCSIKDGSPSCDSKEPFNLNMFNFNTYSRKLKMELHVYLFLWWKDAKIPCSASAWLYCAQPGPWEKRTCYATETLWGNRNNMVSVTKPSNSIYNGITGSLWITVILADSRYIN